MMIKLNDFEQMCKNLRAAKKSGVLALEAGTNYEGAYVAVKKYVSNDKNRLLNLKGQARTGDFLAHLSGIASIWSLFISIVALLFSTMCVIAKDDTLMLSLYGIFVFLFIIFASVHIKKFLDNFSGVNEWRGYIQLAIEELEKEMVAEKID